MVYFQKGENMKHSIFLTVVLSMLILTACDSGDRSSEDSAKTTSPEDKGYVTINKMKYPLYPGVTVDQNLIITVSYHVDADPAIVKAWYDKQMVTEGWRSMADWNNFGGQFQKDFLKGEALKNPNFAQSMVKIAVSPNKKKGGTHLMIMPIVNRYKRKK